MLDQELEWLDGVQRAKRPARLPVVLSRDEAAALLARLDGVRWLMASLLCGAGLRLQECLQLRVKDIDTDQNRLIVRDGKGGRDRITMLPDCVTQPMQLQLERVRTIHDTDLADGFGENGYRDPARGRRPPIRPSRAGS